MDFKFIVTRTLHWWQRMLAEFCSFLCISSMVTMVQKFERIKQSLHCIHKTKTRVRIHPLVKILEHVKLRMCNMSDILWQTQKTLSQKHSVVVKKPSKTRPPAEHWKKFLTLHASMDSIYSKIVQKAAAFSKIWMHDSCHWHESQTESSRWSGKVWQWCQSNQDWQLCFLLRLTWQERLHHPSQGDQQKMKRLGGTSSEICSGTSR